MDGWRSPGTTEIIGRSRLTQERDPDENWVDCNTIQAGADGDYKLLQALLLSRRLLASTGGG